MPKTRPDTGAAEPRLSVVMPVHNALPYLDDAVESILRQSFGDFRFLIYDDASTDGSRERLREWARRDARIQLFEGERQLGPALSSAEIASRATTPLVARMDADDVSLPDRFRRQLAVLDDRPEVGLVAGLCDVIDSHGRFLRTPEYWRIGRASSYAPFPHGSITYRREVYERAGGYRAECEYWEDQDLVMRMAAAAPLLVIPESLYQYRLTLRSTRVTSRQDRVERAVDLMYRSMRALERTGNYEPLLLEQRSARGRLDPRVFVAAGSLLLWAGGTPRVFTRLLRRGRLRPDIHSLAALVWAGWASLSPSSLRYVLMRMMKLRNRRAARSAAGGPIAWQPVHLVALPRRGGVGGAAAG